MTSTTTTLQSVIEKLTGFWHAQGCAVLPPCSFEVPLGLLHPEAFFRLLDPGPWRAAFLQPISRPADARGGRHPYRTARHLQLQVVWKDIDPRRPRDLMLESLRHVGFDLREHDLRFVDQSLEIEACEVSGRGWRVVLDGLRLARITFLERLAGEPLSRPSVELSYGVELVAMARSGASDIFGVPWRTAAEVRESPEAGGRAKRREGEEELHAYALDVADVAYLRQTIDGLDREALRCIEAELPRIAYEQAMRMLPLLDLLETRGDLGFRERSQRLGEIRGRVTEAARAYLRAFRIATDGGSDPAGITSPAADALASDSEAEVAAAQVLGAPSSSAPSPDVPISTVPESAVPELAVPESAAPSVDAGISRVPDSDGQARPKRRRRKKSKATIADPGTGGGEGNG